MLFLKGTVVLSSEASETALTVERRLRELLLSSSEQSSARGT